MADAYVLMAIVLAALITFALRAMPFVAGRWLRRNSMAQQLGDTLPLAIMVLLVADTIAGQAGANPHGIWQELLAIAVVLGLQLVTRQTLLSILLGTGLYVFLRMM